MAVANGTPPAARKTHHFATLINFYPDQGPGEKTLREKNIRPFSIKELSERSVLLYVALCLAITLNIAVNLSVNFKGGSHEKVRARNL
jgi:hypothetical protein